MEVARPCPQSPYSAFQALSCLGSYSVSISCSGLQPAQVLQPQSRLLVLSLHSGWGLLSLSLDHLGPCSFSRSWSLGLLLAVFSLRDSSLCPHLCPLLLSIYLHLWRPQKLTVVVHTCNPN
jgi:hypothetical protein